MSKNLIFQNVFCNELKGFCLPLLVVPQPWNMENVARLLILCGNSICYSVLASKAINRRHFEISRLLIFLILVSYVTFLVSHTNQDSAGILLTV